MPEETQRLLILYGSQTGQAKAIAEEIFSRIQSELDFADNGVQLSLFSLEFVDKKFSIDKESRIVFVVSTTGEGEPPDNALKFWRRIRKKTLPTNHLEHLHYGLLALGDSNYNRFANCGKDLDHRLNHIGAKRFIDTGFGDDGIGLEIGVEPWIEKLLLILPRLFGIVTLQPVAKTSVLTMSEVTLPGSPEPIPSLTVSPKALADLAELSLPAISSKINTISVTFDDGKTDEEFAFPTLPVMESKVFDAEITSIKSIVKDANLLAVDKKEVFEIEVRSKEDSLPPFVAGDSFGFIPGYSDQEISVVLERLGLTGKSQSSCAINSTGLPHLPKRIRLHELIKFYLELRSVPKKSALRHLADFCDNDVQKRRLLELSSREGADDYSKYIRNKAVGFVDILSDFDSCKPTLEALLVNIPCFTPRYYSVVNHPVEAKSGTIAKFAFTVIDVEPICGRDGTRLHGVFTGLVDRTFKNHGLEGQLEKLKLDQSQVSSLLEIKAFKRKNAHFKLPEDSSVPLLLIAPGTGVAPFIGFLEQRELEKSEGKKIGDIHLVFGCRYSNHDFIYEDQLKGFVDRKVLTKLFVCFSREDAGDEPGTKYVQDMIKKKGKVLLDVITNAKTHIFVCGDAKMMSVNVFNSIVSVLEDAGSYLHEPAVKFVREMQLEKRYLQDVWV